MKKIFSSIVLMAAVSIGLISCGEASETPEISEIPVPVETVPITEAETEEETTEIAETTVITTTTIAATTITTSTEPVTTTVKVEAIAPSISVQDIPAYNGTPYIEINGNKPFFDDYPTQEFEIYSPLDDLGRCGVAYANISVDLMPTEKRGEIGEIKPSGWHTANYNGLIEDIYLYNRCHLIGYQLAGENANELNLITGTRYMNIEGMQPFENKVANYVRSYNAHVLYRVTPMFEGDNLLASGVLMEAYSLDNNGSGVQFCVYCYNVQPNIGINYADGESWSLIQETEAPPIEIVPDRAMPVPDNTTTYILNTNTKKFHYPSCSSVKDMKDKNKQEYSGTRDEVIAMGYDPCKRCNP